MQQQNVEEIKSSFMVKSRESDKSIEVIDNFEMTKEFRDLVVIPYFKEKYEVQKRLAA